MIYKIKNKIRTIKHFFSNLFFSNSIKYWNNRYKNNLTSGHGSYGEIAKFKADIINEFIEKNNIKSIIEIGCGDGNQLNMINCDKYIGFDVSDFIINKCKDKFINNPTKQFYKVSEYNNQKADCSMSLDVIYHCIELDNYENHLKLLFNSSNKYVIIFSSNFNENLYIRKAPHLLHRKFTDYIENNIPGWKLINKIEQKYKYNKNTGEGSLADFFFYQKK